MNQKSLIPIQRIERRIIFLRNEKVMLDGDLAEMYGVTTKALNQAVKRNSDRFPDDFMFRLTDSEKQEVVTNCDHLINLKFSRTNPYAFTEQGVAMLSSVLRSPRAVQVNVQIMRTFVRLRQMLASNAGLAKKLDELERKYDHHFKIVFDAIRQLAQEQEIDQQKSRKRIGYYAEQAGR